MKFHTRSDDFPCADALNAEHSKHSLNALTNQKKVLQFDIWPQEISLAVDRSMKHAISPTVYQFSSFLISPPFAKSPAHIRQQWIDMMKGPNFVPRLGFHKDFSFFTDSNYNLKTRNLSLIQVKK